MSVFEHPMAPLTRGHQRVPWRREGGFLRPPWQALEPALDPGTGTGRAFVCRGAAAGCGVRDGDRAPLCAAAPRGSGDGAGCGDREQRWQWGAGTRGWGDGTQEWGAGCRDGSRPQGQPGSRAARGNVCAAAEALCKHVNLFSFLPRLSG